MRSRQAASAVVAAYWPLLRRWTRHYRAPRASAEDLLQIAACGLLKSLARFDPRRSKFDTYAYHCVLGEVRHYLRDHAGMIQVPRSMWERGEGPTVGSLDALLDGGSPSAQIGWNEPGMARADDRIQLWEMLRDLHPRQGAALLLWVGFQIRQQTVADILGIPQHSVSRFCTRALRTLRTRARTAHTGDSTSASLGGGQS